MIKIRDKLEIRMIDEYYIYRMYDNISYRVNYDLCVVFQLTIPCAVYLISANKNYVVHIGSYRSFLKPHQNMQWFLGRGCKATYLNR
jgi:hypothetical protein